MSDSLQSHASHHARPPCPSPTPRVHPNSCASSRWCHPAISSSVVPFSFCLQLFLPPGSFAMTQLFASGGQNIGVSASAPVLPMNIQDWFPLRWTGVISLQSKDSQESSQVPQWLQFSSVQFSHSVVSARPPCPSSTPGVHPNSCASSRWCHPAISFSVALLSSCPQSLPAAGSFPMRQLFTWGGQSIGVSASVSVLPMNIQDCSSSSTIVFLRLWSCCCYSPDLCSTFLIKKKKLLFWNSYRRVVGIHIYISCRFSEW